MVYDDRKVDLHSNNTAKVILINEAPGPREADSGIPLFGSQGGNLYRSLIKANVSWAINFNNGMTFTWPTKIKSEYISFKAKQQMQFELRSKFLSVRQQYIGCTNSYSYWPKSSPHSINFLPPLKSDVLSSSNLDRLKSEISDNYKVLLVCGAYSYLACTGGEINNPATHEGNLLDVNILRIINERLEASFSHAWYMGHTGRWALNQKRINQILSTINW